MVKYSSTKKTENDSNHYENLGRGLTDRLNSGIDCVENSNVYNLTKKCSNSLKNKAKFVSSSLTEAAKESAQKSGIPTNRSYWREHPGRALLATGLAIGGVATAGCDAYALTDTQTYRFGIPEVPSGVSFIPPRRFVPPGPEIIIPVRYLGVGDYLSLAAPFILLGLAATIKKYYYDKWKKSNKKTEEESKQWR